MQTTTAVIFIPSGWLQGFNQLDRDTLLRLQRGLTEWKKQRTALILVSGGLFRAPSIQTIPAAQLMADWLVKQGVSKTRLLIEPTSLDTFENVSFGLQRLKSRKINPLSTHIRIVSQWQHTLRLWVCFRWGYRIPVQIIPLWHFSTLKQFFLEWALLIYYFFDPQGTGSLIRHQQKRKALRRF